MVLKALAGQLEGQEGKGEVSMAKAMVAAGYSPRYAYTGSFSRNKVWIDLVEKELPDGVLATKHRALLDKEQVITRNNNKTGEIETIRTGEMDTWAAKNALDLAYKIKNKYDNTINIRGGISALSDAEIEDRIAGAMATAMRSLSGESQEATE